MSWTGMMRRGGCASSYGKLAVRSITASGEPGRCAFRLGRGAVGDGASRGACQPRTRFEPSWRRQTWYRAQASRSPASQAARARSRTVGIGGSMGSGAGGSSGYPKTLPDAPRPGSSDQGGTSAGRNGTKTGQTALFPRLISDPETGRRVGLSWSPLPDPSLVTAIADRAAHVRDQITEAATRGRS